MNLVIMGVAGCGKSTLGRALAERLGRPFIEGDDLHPPENIAAMAAGRPLTDEMRAPWIAAVGAALRARAPAVAACSALRRSYRDQLRAASGGAAFIWLKADEPLIRARLAARRGHFMPASLIESQFAALEPPGDEEAALVIAADMPLEDQLSRALKNASM